MRTLPLLLLMCCVAGCAVLPDSLRPSFREHSNSPLQNEVERLAGQLSPAQLAAARQRINTSAAPGRPF